MKTPHPNRIVWFLALALVSTAGGNLCLGTETKPGPTEMTQSFLSAADHYRRGEYSQAALDFQSIAEAGMINGKLFYNLANAYMKSGDLGRAILWYERAMELIPSDPDLAFNYQYAASLLKDESGEKDALYRILFFWKYRISRQAILLAAVVLNAAFWIILSYRILTKRRPFNTAAAAAMAAALILTLTAGYNYFEERHRRRGVVLSEQVSVRSGLTPEATELFVLHAGTRIRVQRETSDFLRIYFAPGKIGWVRKDEVGII